MKIGYLGPKGTFSEQAALRYQRQIAKGELVEYRSIFDVLESVEKGETQACVVPLENSIEGTVTSTIDRLIFCENLYIQAEMVIPVREDFLVNQNYKGEQITKVLSHPQALAQCTDFLRKNFPKSVLVPVNSTADAARTVASSQEPIAALATKRAGEVYGLRCLYQQVQDDDSNETRFVVVAQNCGASMGNGGKTSIVFSTQNKPGDLYRILDILSIWDINMTKIESRPMKHQLGTYVFFIDMETESLSDLKSAMEMIQRKTSYFKCLGSYPVLYEKGGNEQWEK